MNKTARLSGQRTESSDYTMKLFENFSSKIDEPIEKKINSIYPIHDHGKCKMMHYASRNSKLDQTTGPILIWNAIICRSRVFKEAICTISTVVYPKLDKVVQKF